ncbi:MAG: hypothetical protein BMS9Abin02_1908 [Anaerolineae bacterium]|nr:MAG: hypothetical protein BMS9Abin02_1908 [Anaerolineae bacterium]
MLDNDDFPRSVVCPQGQVTTLETGRKGDWLLARFDRTACEDRLFFNQHCRVRPNKRKPPTLIVCPCWIQAALLRQSMSPANNALRAGVEITVRSFKHVFPAGKLPVRGVIRSVMGAVVAERMDLISHAFFGLWAKMRHFLSRSRAEVLTGSYPAY